MLRHKLLVTAAIVAAISFQAPAFAQEDPVVAKVGTLTITQSELDLAMQNLDPQLAQLPDEQKKVAALSGAIDVKLLASGALAEGVDKTEDFKKRMAYIGDRELHNSFFRKHVVEATTDAEVKARYDKEIAALPKQEEVKAAHILVKTEDEAKAIIAKLDKGEDFATLAKENSQDSNKDDGGDLGWFGPGRMVPEFEEAAFGLEKGAYTKAPVKTQFGFHIIKVEDKRDAPPPAFDQVKDQVKQLVMRDKYVAILEKAKAEQKVEITDEALKKGYEEVGKMQDGAGDAAAPEAAPAAKP
ncbi:peptidylprolyl isomerase [Aliirhizobium cellulosilyticum]|jgi:peptidyl-prolyl cis-trans isomerase C|uniref:Parvulin-like PPIase n=1 Tax=Aliirhizobium cellulosilyticum TaxID=393664 RepID=A0A7W6Y482_9HYPH|nr:peptidylprolyl isomerase [Rhizobium cellulosilyticum]MBB4350821.1 peptidyl-prolyl cis-trans isomerase C [Rhizobium cellulosilyticum]MBB4414191.1 peptidyl-prolyl cis-trans isomerase C [Rhizobium cellulosilyticum]MBB4448807.1 peptidyl-prolyl cis-trans isomerase C [Rhizobium cellulosilyticum]